MKEDIATEPLSSRPTLEDVARLAGVSASTVSRVLNGQKYIARSTRDRVLEALQKLGYEPHALQKLGYEPRPEQARQLLVGLTSIDMGPSVYASIVAGVVEGLHERNAHPIISPLPLRHNCHMSLIERLMYETTVGGLIVGSTENDEEVLATIQRNFPCVVIYPHRQLSEAIPVVTSSNWYGSRAAAEHLISLGHTDIGVIKQNRTSVSENFAGRERFAGFQSTMLMAGLPIQPEYIYEIDNDVEEIGYQAGRYFLGLSKPPTAIVAYNDVMAAGIIQAAHATGFAVPQQLSVIGFDDLLHAHLLSPPLTTIRQPFEEMGRVSVDMLFRLIEGRTLEATRIELIPRLVVRDSTAPPASTK